MNRGDKGLKRLLKSVCKPVPAPPEFKKRLLERLLREVEVRKIKKGSGI